ncbi:hypothetical protein E4U17_007779 [Claviceps sp. LM77 group G4]|nr:hypothetical protein E4U17_007779 [Claviceps sp. LM77 group G4]KAG6055794.1 hypothetical protein E4U33_007790 [Claviceps sp. LM78 group G4]
MAVLVAYASSDDEDVNAPQVSSPKLSPGQETRLDPSAPDQEASLRTQPPSSSSSSSSSHLPPQEKEQTTPTRPPSQSKLQEQATIGQLPLGPSLPPSDTNLSSLREPLPEPSPSPEPSTEADTTKPPSSPYSSTRAIMHDLTLPSLPNLTIPSSPPGSPPPATTKKFQQFLHLKRQGTHFNSKLESSTALRNPSLTDKLLSFVDVTGPAQYETTLPLDLYNPTSFPAYAHRDKLRKSREVLVKEREGEKVTARGVDFVSASGTSTPVGGGGGGAGAGAGAGGGGLITRAEKRKSGWK